MVAGQHQHRVDRLLGDEVEVGAHGVGVAGRKAAIGSLLPGQPLLGPVRLSRLTALDYDESPEGAEVYPLRGLYAVPDCDWSGPKVDWVIVGGESGPGARPMHPEWARSLRDQCEAAGVPFLFKQWGEWAPRSECYHTLTSGKAAADIDPSATKWPCIRLTGAEVPI